MSGDHDFWLDPSPEEEYKVEVYLTITSHGVSSTVSFEKDDDCSWQEIIDPIIKHVEAHWGYPFDLNQPSLDGTTVGMWYPGKHDDV